MDPHKAMYYISAVVGMIGIGFALYFHLLRRKLQTICVASIVGEPFDSVATNSDGTQMVRG